MAYEEIVSLDADITIALGGVNKKTNKANPTQVEGYFLGVKVVASPKSKGGVCNIYILKTAKGNVGVWSKTNLDTKMRSAVLGRMTLLVQSGTQKTQNGEMYLYTVKQDATNTVAVAAAAGPELDSNEGIDSQYNGGGNEGFDGEEDDNDSYEQEEQQAQSALAQAERKAKTEALLNRNKSTVRK